MLYCPFCGKKLPHEKEEEIFNNKIKWMNEETFKDIKKKLEGD